jgi:hypothetical protein
MCPEMRIVEATEQVTMKLGRAIGDFHSSADDGIDMMVIHGGGLFDSSTVAMFSGVEEKVTLDNVGSGPRGVEVVVVCVVMVGVLGVSIGAVVGVDAIAVSAVTVEELGVGKGITVAVEDACCCKPFPRRRYCCSKSKSFFSNSCFLTFSALEFIMIAAKLCLLAQ